MGLEKISLQTKIIEHCPRKPWKCSKMTNGQRKLVKFGKKAIFGKKSKLRRTISRKVTIGFRFRLNVCIRESPRKPAKRSEMTNERRKLVRFDKKAFLIKIKIIPMDNISKSCDRISIPSQRVRSGEPKEARKVSRNDRRATQVGQIG